LDERLLAPCGIHCGLCPYFNQERTPYCPGCNSLKGHAFWGECKLYACAADHKVEHCGVCAEFPCGLFVSLFDPEHGYGQKDAIMRAGLLAYRKRAGTEKYVEMVKKLRDEEMKTV